MLAAATIIVATASSIIMIVSVFFDGWESLVRILVVGILAYLTLILTLGISGRRLIAKMNALDFVGSIALGSTLASVVLNKNIALANGIVAFAVLQVLPLLINFLSSRARMFKKNGQHRTDHAVLRGADA